MRENRQSGSEGGVVQTNAPSLPLCPSTTPRAHPVHGPDPRPNILEVGTAHAPWDPLRPERGLTVRFTVRTNPADLPSPQSARSPPSPPH
jgi:hypothetical protein